jgi:hypothetical protein
MPIFEDAERITYGEFLRQQKGLNDKVMRLQWKSLIEELSQVDATELPETRAYSKRDTLEEKQPE